MAVIGTELCETYYNTVRMWLRFHALVPQRWARDLFKDGWHGRYEG